MERKKMLMDTAMDFRFPQTAENVLSVRLQASQEGLCLMELVNLIIIVTI
jgi:hypothetical protein